MTSSPSSPKPRSPRRVSTRFKDPHIRAAWRYSEQVVSGAIPACRFVQRACRRSLADFQRQGTDEFPYRFDSDRASRVCRFIEHLNNVKGAKANQRIRLEPWQLWVLTQIFGWLTPAGKRRFRRSYLELPRGNGKSTLSSGIALYMLVADGEAGADVYSCATTRDQARIVFRDAQQMARKSPELMNRLGASVLAHAIVVECTNSRFTTLSSEANTLDGLNIHCAIVDELHAHPTSAVYDAIQTGLGKRDQSLLFAITTAGSNQAGVCYEQHQYLGAILAGTIHDDQQFGCIWTLDEADDWQQESSWVKANPNWGVSVEPSYVAGLAKQAMQLPAARTAFLTKHCDIWCNADIEWMPMDAFSRCGDPKLSIDDFEGEDCWIGLDLASKVDIAAVVRLFIREIDSVKHYYVFPICYLPEAGVANNTSYAGWEVQGYLRVSPGETTDFEMIKSDILDDCNRFRVMGIAYDPWQATMLAQQLEQEGADPIEYRNNVANFSAPMKEIQALVMEGLFHHNNDPCYAWQISNVVCHTDAKDNIFPRKSQPQRKIDAVVATIMALGLAMNGDSGFAYDDGREILFI